MTFVVDVDEVDFCSTSQAVDGVVSGRVEVPAFQVGNLVVPMHGRITAVIIVLRGCEVEGRTVAPIAPGP